MSRVYDDNQNLQQRIIKGANKLADNVASTLGPGGRNVLLQEKGRTPFITKDGVTVAAFVECLDPFENAAAQIIKQAAVETNNEAGDGTTTATVLARAILRESQKLIASGTCPIELQRGIHLAVKEVVNNLTTMATPVKSLDDIRHIATISANNDTNIGGLIATAIDRIGHDGSITIEESRSMDTSIELAEGFKLGAGYSAGAFITDERRAIMHHEDPLLLITDYKISTVEEILPLLETIARESRPLIVIAEEVEGQALAALIMNAMRGTLKVAAINAPEYGEERRNILDDLALSVGATFVSREQGLKLKDVQMKDLGSAKFIESSKHHTTVVGGNCDLPQVEERIALLKSTIETTENMEECRLHQNRITRLASGVAVIRVGGATEVEMTEKKHRIEDALEAVRSAQEEGVIPGGGLALLKASRSLCIITEGDSNDQGLGISIIQVACEEPIRQMASNAGLSADIIIDKVLENNSTTGWDFRNNEMVDLIEKGIIDPLKVTKTALQNAASCAGTLITTNFGIIQTEDE